MPRLIRPLPSRRSNRLYRQNNPRLPTEIILQIIALTTDIGSLRAWTLVRKDLHLDAKRALCSSITIRSNREISRHWTPPDAAVSRRLGRIETFFRNHPELRAEMKSWSFKVNCPYALWLHVPGILAAYPSLSHLDLEFILQWEDLANCLWKMFEDLPDQRYTLDAAAYKSRLRSLRISDVTTWEFTTLILLGVENSVKFPLEHLSFDAIGRNFHAPEYARSMGDWFCKHPSIFRNLVSLELGQTSQFDPHNSDEVIIAVASVPMSCFPHLKSFTFAPILPEAARAGLEFLEGLAGQITDIDWKANFRLVDSSAFREIPELNRILIDKHAFLSKFPNLKSLKLSMIVANYNEFNETMPGNGYPTVQAWVDFLTGIGPNNKLEHFAFNIYFKAHSQAEYERPMVLCIPHEPLPFLFPIAPASHESAVLNSPGRAIKNLFDTVLANKSPGCDFGKLRRVDVRIYILDEYTVEYPDDPFLLDLIAADRLKEYRRLRRIWPCKLVSPSPWVSNFDEELKHSFVALAVGDLAEVLDIHVNVGRFTGDTYPQYDI